MRLPHRSRDRVPLLAVAAGAVGLSGLVLLTWAFFGTPSPHDTSSAATDSPPAAAAAESSRTLPIESLPSPPEDSSEAVTPRVRTEASSPDWLLGELQVHGTVRDTQNTIVADAEIWFEGEVRTHSDANGEYQVVTVPKEITATDLRSRFGLLAAFKKGAGWDLQEFPRRGGTVDFRLRNTGVVAGYALAENRSRVIPGTKIELWMDPDWEGLPRHQLLTRETVVDHRGHFEFRGVPAGRISLQARARGHGMASPQKFEFRGETFRDANLKLVKTGRVRGRFAPWPPPGQPQDADLSLAVQAPRSFLPRETLHSDGSFEFEILGPLTFVTLALETAQNILWIGELAVPTNSRSKDVGEISIQAPSGLHGTIAIPASGRDLGLQVRVVPMVGSVGLFRDFPVDSTGAFNTGPLPPGFHSLALCTGSQMLTPLGIHRIQAGQPQDLGELSIPHPFVTGTVANEQGELYAGRVQLELEVQNDRGQWIVEASEPVGADSVYVLRPASKLASLTESPTRIVARCRGIAPQLTEFVFETEYQRTDLVLRFGESARGMLRRAGAPLADWSVVWSDPKSGAACSGVSADDGSFWILGLDANQHYEVHVEHPEHDQRFEFPEPLRSGEGIELNLESATAHQQS